MKTPQDSQHISFSHDTSSAKFSFRVHQYATRSVTVCAQSSMMIEEGLYVDTLTPMF